MTYAILDVETTTKNKGNPFDIENRCIMYGMKDWCNNTTIIDHEMMGSAYHHMYTKKIFEDVTVVGFNIKFDLHWSRKVGVDISNLKVWDCQIAEFLLSNQENKFPSLNDTCKKYELPLKEDEVKIKYWDKGIDTDDIPRSVLSKYLQSDLDLTERVYLIQRELFKGPYKHLYPLFKLCCQDLLVLQDMEWNGIKFNTDLAKKEAENIRERTSEIKEKINGILGGIPASLTSDYDLSAIFYGGVIIKPNKIPIGIFKSGKKVGQVRMKTIYNTFECPRLVEPIKGSEIHTKVTQRELDYVTKEVLESTREWWSTDADTLMKIKTKGVAKQLKDLVVEFNKLEKLCGTYLEGWSTLIDKMGWDKDTLHPQLNQCSVITGRLSSSNPNGQNADKRTKLYCESRYE